MSSAVTRPPERTPKPAPEAAGEPTSGRTIGQLVSDATADLSSIVRGEIELAKVEVKSDAVNAGKGAGMFVGAGVLGLYAFGLLLLAAAWGLATWMPLWAGLLIVAVVLLVVAGVLAFIGKKNVSKVQGKPVKTIDNAQKTLAAVKPSP